MPTSLTLQKSPDAHQPPPAKSRAQGVRSYAGRTTRAAAVISVILCGVISAAGAPADLSGYRGFRFGADLAAVGRQADADVSQAKLIHGRPAVMQDLAWRPQRLGAGHQDESADDVVFSFYNGGLYRIAISYDRYKTEGMTVEDMIDAVSTMYGPAETLTPPLKAASGRYGDEDEVVARWQDPQYSFDLIRTSYGPAFRLVGVIKSLDAQAQAAMAEAKRLDELDAPQREAAKAAKEETAAKAKLEKTRLANKARFQP